MQKYYADKQERMYNLYQKTCGFMKGICHPVGDVSLLHEAGVDWVRIDVPYPNGKGYENFRQRITNYAQRDIRAVLVSPYPSAFLNNGIDPSTRDGLKKVEDICAQMAADFAHCRPVWQATNEMHMAHFRVPLTEKEAVDFLVASIRGLRRGDPNAAVGHNSIEEAWLENALIVDHCSGGADYIGLDLYAGTWMPGDENTYMQMIDRVYDVLKRPVILMEFGFASLGDTMQDVNAEVLGVLNSWGFGSLEDAEQQLDRWIDSLPPRLKAIALEAAPEERLNTVKQEFFLHILKKWPCPSFLPHTEEGQAEFYRKLLPMLLDHPHLGGAAIYCMSDSEHCFLCGEPDCPLEIAWGLLRVDGSKKTAYYAVKSIFNNTEELYK